MKKKEALSIIKGQQGCIHSYVLEYKLNLKGREVRRIINTLRKEGEPIGTCKEGYFYAQETKGLQDTIDSLLKHARSFRQTARAMQKYLQTKLITN